MNPVATATRNLSANSDVARRAPDISWPTGFSPDDADLFSHNEIVIDASPATIWRHLVDAPKWPDWYPNSQDVRIIGGRDRMLKQDMHFQFDTFGLHIEALVYELIPDSRLAWFGKGLGIDAYHTWLLDAVPGGCRVVTEEVAKGPAAVALRDSDPSAMHRGHGLWLKMLKIISEK